MLRHLYKMVFASLLLSVFPSWAGTHIMPITAQAWLVADKDGKKIDGNNTEEIRSIASITKLMTVMIVLDAGQDLDEVISTKHLNRKLTRRDLISLSIVKSDNTASKILCDKYITGYKGCIQAMNDKARSLEMTSTQYTDPTGLFNDNVSTAADLVKLVIAASKYPIIVEDSKKDKVVFPINKKKNAYYNNTNRLVHEGYEFVVSKTGWITKSGGCIVMMMETVNGIRTVILLGSKNTKTRIPEAKLLALAY